MIFADSDNALGSSRGDIDDGVALAVLLRSGLPVEALASTFGNTTTAEATRNNRELLARARADIPCLTGAATPAAPPSEAAQFLGQRSRAEVMLALGPLTNLAHALAVSQARPARLERVYCLGSNPSSFGRWPPLWPFEFNFTKDPRALVRVFESGLPLFVVPLDQAGRLRVRFGQLEALRDPLGDYLREHAARWFVRARRLKLQGSVPVWDLAAVGALLWPELYQWREATARAHASGWVEYGRAGRPVQLLGDFDPEAVWERSVRLLNESAECKRAPSADTPDSSRRTA